MAYSYIKYMGNGESDTFAIPFPYISKTHVHVNVNGIFAIYEWLTSNSIRITPTPADGALVNIERRTSQDVRLVDFEDGSNLTEAELDLANTQNFYMAQEALDKIEALTTAGLNAVGEDGVINIPPDSLLQQIVNDVLASALYNDLRTRIDQLDVVSEAQLRDSLRAERTINKLRAQSETNANHYALIQEEMVARITADSANADAVLTVQTALNGNIATVQTHASSINGLQGQYTVKIDVNGYVAGYGLAVHPNNDGAHTSEFIILADTFAIVQPNAPVGATPIVPFVVGTSYGASTVGINGQLIVNGTIYADAIAANTITADKLGVNQLSAISADIGAITAGSLTFQYGAGAGNRYLQMDKTSSYPIWYGAGTKNDANGIFYIKTDGTAFFKGALTAGSNFTVDAAGNVVMKSVQIRDASNNLVFSVGTGMEWSHVSGTGKPEDGATVGASFGVNIGGQINMANVSTYIASAAIGEAQIANLAVGTLKVQNQAITSGASVTTNTDALIGTTYTTIASLTVNFDYAGSVLLDAGYRAECQAYDVGTGQMYVSSFHQFRLQRDGVTIFESDPACSWSIVETLSKTDSAAAGDHTYSLQVKAIAQGGSSSVNIMDSWLSVLSRKK